MNKKITFADKESSLKINSQYVLSAPEINEIKKVINNISNEIDLQLKSSDFFKYLSIYIPQNVQNNSDLSIIFGNNETFTNSIEIKLSTYSSRFLYFDNVSGTYKSFNKTSINSDDAGKLLLFKLENLIPPNYFYVKYNFENQDNKILSYYNIDKQNQKINEIEINYFPPNELPEIVNPDQIHNFTVDILSSDLYDGEFTTFIAKLDDEDVTLDEKLHYSYSGNISINGNIISPNDQIMNDENVTINFSYTDQYGKTYYADDSIELKKINFRCKNSK